MDSTFGYEPNSEGSNPSRKTIARVMELVDIAVLETVAEMHESSSLSLGTFPNGFTKTKAGRQKNKTTCTDLN